MAVPWVLRKWWQASWVRENQSSGALSVCIVRVVAVSDEVGGCFTYRFAWVLWVVLGVCFVECNKQSRLEGRVRNASAYLYLVFAI